ncbi:MAG: hypothetical protein U0414_29950 [Polyangiaceae bacterium]
MAGKLNHGDTPKSDQKLEEEAAAHLAANAPLQLMTELLMRLREMAFPWWTPEHLRVAYPAKERLKWLAARPDLRQRITTDLTGLAPKAARNKTPDFQAELIDSVIDDGDIDADTFERSFEPADLVVYGDAADQWRLFRRRMPWDDDRTTHQDLVGWLLGALLADKSMLDGKPRTPILTALAMRTGIDGRVWHSKIPLDVRVEIDNARFAALRDRPGEPFTAAQDLSIATPALLAASIPLKEFTNVLDLAGVALGFESEKGAPSPSPPPTERRPSVAPPPVSAAPARVSTPPPALDASPKASVPPAAASGEREISGVQRSPKADPKSDGAKADVPKNDGAKADARADAADDEAKPRTKSEAPSVSVSAEPALLDERMFDELEHTNPWLVPSGIPEVEAAKAAFAAKDAAPKAERKAEKKK